MLAASFRCDPVIRLMGLLMLAAAARCLFLLFTGPGAYGTCGAQEFGEATLGFVGGSLGLVLVALGKHAHDRVIVSERWVRVRRPVGGAYEDSSASYPNDAR